MTDRQLAQLLGVGVGFVRDTRSKLTEGVHWQMEGPSVQWTAAGIQMVLKSTGAPMDFLQDEPTKIVVDPSTRNVRNTMIVMGNLKGERVRVRVRSNRNFIPGMEMPCRHLNTDLWELVGNCPRARGRW
jgi:hypothetical protein